MSSDASSRRGRLFVITAPSGAGKTTLVKALVAARPDMRFSISYTTRKQRTGEIDARDYYFVDRPTFESMRDAGAFLEHADVFGNYYGTAREQVNALLGEGRDVILEIDWQGARQVRDNMPECRSIFILPPSLEELERRLRGRGTDTDEVIARRLGEAIGDIGHWAEFDEAVVNDDLDAAAQRLVEIVEDRAAPDKARRKLLAAKVGEMLDTAQS